MMADQDVVRGDSADRPAPARETSSPAAAPTRWSGRGATRGRPAARRTPDAWEIEWAPFIASTSAGPEGPAASNFCPRFA